MAPKRQKTMKKMHITLIGGGNSTAIFAALAGEAGHDVSVLTRRPTDWASSVGFTNEDEGYLNGAPELFTKLHSITSDPKECIPTSDMVFIAGLPIHHNPTVLAQIAPFLRTDGATTYIGSICSYGGFNWVARNALAEAPDGAIYELFGTQLIPWTCGTLKYGERGVVFGAKRMLRIATETPAVYAELEAPLQAILQIPDLRPTDFLACCMWPNNPSLHPPILFGLFEHWDGKTGYDAAELPVWIYKDLRTESSRYLVELDNEVQAIVAALSKAHPNNPHLKLDYSMKACIEENYKEQVLNRWDTISAIQTNVAFGKHKIPYTTLKDKTIVPTIKHKFFETDLPFGLVTWHDIAQMAGVATPLIDRIIVWNQKLVEKDFMNVKTGALDGKDIDECVVPSRLGLTLETLAAKL